MSETISYANEARKQVGKYLVEQCGYAKRTATRFYKNGDEILSCLLYTSPSPRD